MFRKTPSPKLNAAPNKLSFNSVVPRLPYSTKRPLVTKKSNCQHQKVSLMLNSYAYYVHYKKKMLNSSVPPFNHTIIMTKRPPALRSLKYKQRKKKQKLKF
jgi:hypothetical protein